jgi:hypothetical protein
MSEDRIQAMKDDIAFMKALAQEGRGAPLLGGSILVLAGAAFGLASLGHWAVATERLDAGPAAYGWMWGAATLIFFVGLVALGARIDRRPGAASSVNKASGAAWAAVGGAIFTLAVAGVVAGRKLDMLPFLSAYFPSMIIALYGTGWLVSGEMASKGWIKFLAFASFGFSVMLAFAAGDPLQYLVYAGALFALALVPGLILMRDASAGAV